MRQLILCISLSAYANLHGQIITTPVFCGNDLFSQIIRENHPELHEALKTTFEEARSSTLRRSEDPLTINKGGTQQMILDTNTLPGGVYIVKVNTLNGFQARTLIVNHDD